MCRFSSVQVWESLIRIPRLTIIFFNPGSEKVENARKHSNLVDCTGASFSCLSTEQIGDDILIVIVNDDE